MTKPLGPLPFVALVCVTWLGGVLGGTVLVGPATPSPTPTPPIAIRPIEPEPTPTAFPSPSPTLSLSPVVVPTFSTPEPTLGPPSPSVLPTTPRPTASPTSRPTPLASPVPSPTPTPSPLPTPDPPATPAATPLPAIAITCANGVDNGGGTGTICEIVITPVGATVLECHGAAGDPRALCELTTYSGRVTSVTACDGTANGGGATLRCSVTGVGTGPASVRLCEGSGAGGTLVELTCTGPLTAAIPVSLCNGSGNGGGALVICRVEG